jgi:hypothetical protein
MASLNRDDLVRLLGPISDHTIVEVLKVKASMEDIEEVAMRLEQEDDVMGDLRKSLIGAAARIHDIIMRDPLYVGDEREERRGAS